jgi:hypothetical protein
MANTESAPTQQFVEIKEIQEDLVVLRTGGLRKVLLVSGINVELKSEEEQNLIYLEYQNFLNSLDFSLQFIVHSRKLNIERYLKLLEARESEESDELLRNEVSEYREFIRSFVAENDIMSKNFFVVVPYDTVSISTGKTIRGFLPSFMPGKKKPSAEKQAEEKTREESGEIEKNLFQLNQRVDHVVSGLRTIGLRAVPLNKEELVELFYNLYNPESIERQDIKLGREENQENAPQ